MRVNSAISPAKPPKEKFLVHKMKFIIAAIFISWVLAIYPAFAEGARNYTFVILENTTLLFSSQKPQTSFASKGECEAELRKHFEAHAPQRDNYKFREGSNGPEITWSQKNGRRISITACQVIFINRNAVGTLK